MCDLIPAKSYRMDRRRQSERDLTIKELAKDTLARQPEANRRPILVCDASIRGEDSSIVIKLETPCVLHIYCAAASYSLSLSI